MPKTKRSKSDKSVEKKIAKQFAFFDKIAKMGKKIDAGKTVREERDRDELQNCD
jgi:hypothetical protein